MSKDNDALALEGLIREDILSLSAYHVPESDGVIKLDAMENPYNFPEEILQQWTQKLSSININRYPDPRAKGLCEKIRESLNLPSDYDVLLGNGSDEIIQILMTSVASPDACVVAPEPGFVMFKMIAQYCKVDFIGVSLMADFSLDVEKMLKVIEQHCPKIIFIAQPNNPTGHLFAHDDLCALIEKTSGLVVIDEAYTAFTQYDAMPLLEQYENVLIMRTFSKVGLAGLRLGYLIGRHSILQHFDKVRLPYNINVLTQSLAEIAVENFDLLKEQSKKIIESRKVLLNTLQNIKGLELIQSETNFIAVRLEGCEAKEVAAQLRDENILIKVLDGSHPLLVNCLRLTVGLPSENERLVKVLGDLLNDRS